MLAAYLVCAAVRPDPSLVNEDSTVVILDPETALELGIDAIRRDDLDAGQGDAEDGAFGDAADVDELDEEDAADEDEEQAAALDAGRRRMARKVAAERTTDAALLVIPLIVVAVEADQVIRHSRKYLQMLELDACKVMLASGQDGLNRDILPDLATLPDGLVGRFDTVVALQRDDESAIREACDFLRSIFSAEDGHPPHPSQG